METELKLADPNTLILGSLIFVFITYVFYCRCQQVAGQKNGTTWNWLAYVPLLQMFHLCWIGNLSAWWLLTMFIPVVNWVVLIYILIKMFRARGKSGWFVLLYLFPLTTLFSMGYLAYFDEKFITRYFMYLVSFVLTAIITAIYSVLILASISVLSPQDLGHLPPELKAILAEVEPYLEHFRTMALRKKRLLTESELLTRQENFYAWRDAGGTENFATRLEDVPEAYRDQVKKTSARDLGGELRLMDAKEEGLLMNALSAPPVPTQMQHASHEIFVYTYEGNQELQDTLDYLDTFHVPYVIRDVVKEPEFATELKLKLGLELNRKYTLLLPIISIDGELIERIVVETDDNGAVRETALNDRKIKKLFGLRETFE